MKMLMVGLRASPTVLEWECNFPVHLLTCFLQLKPGSLRGLHSDRACGHLTPCWGGAYFIWVYHHFCVCVHAFGEEMFTTGDLMFHIY